MRDRLHTEDGFLSEIFARNHTTDPWTFLSGNPGVKSYNRCRDEEFGKFIVDKQTIISPVSDWIHPDGAGGEYRRTNWVAPEVSPSPDAFWKGRESYWFGTPNQRATRLAAMTNVSTPVVSVNQFVGELKDLPSSIFKRGKQGLHWAKTESLGVRFGIMPMVSDILKLANINDYTTRKGKQISDLLDKKNGYYRRVKMGKITDIVTYDLTSVYNVSVTTTLISESTRWGTIRWLPSGTVPPFDPSDPDRTKLIRGLLTGTSKYNDRVSALSDAWELLPWSWLADWCGNLGTYLQASQNQTISHVDSIWLMEHATSQQTTTTPSGTVTVFRESKMRFPGTITASTISPYMSADRAAILSGLFIRGPSPIPKRYQ
ncbi:TPA_asm: maturation protein [ssRNA phage SRR7976325_25]|uniref:Maturation protein n=1 Tax=ssRNA phage SRR7976325_25 TaxID=2786713 RepID=A0A8S5L180_9VIRU|nr:maturation protein [ssRNA phage SRR7976325_25]DAD51191.1 TPA_asm: maturation protein [ssRNA phage SRR7976325_25]